MHVPSGLVHGALAGGSSETGILLIGILLAAGLQARAAIVNDAATTSILGLARTIVFRGSGGCPRPPGSWRS